MKWPKLLQRPWTITSWERDSSNVSIVQVPSWCPDTHRLNWIKFEWIFLAQFPEIITVKVLFYSYFSHLLVNSFNNISLFPQVTWLNQKRCTRSCLLAPKGNLKSPHILLSHATTRNARQSRSPSWKTNSCGKNQSSARDWQRTASTMISLDL